MPKRKIPAKKTISKFDFTGTGRGPLRVPQRITGGPAMRNPGQGIKKTTPKRKRSK